MICWRYTSAGRCFGVDCRENNKFHNVEPLVLPLPRQKLVQALVNPNTACATLIGKLRSGKTERAIQACKYVQERQCFDAIFFAACDKIVEKADASPTREWNAREDPCSLVRSD